MDAQDFKAALRAAGIRQKAFAELTGHSAVQVNAWCVGRYPVPTWAELLVKLMRDVPEARRRALERLEAESGS